VLRAVDFYDESRSKRGEVRDVRADRVLASEADTQLTAAEADPQVPLGV
jgi:hypothetical protein